MTAQDVVHKRNSISEVSKDLNEIMLHIGKDRKLLQLLSTAADVYDITARLQFTVQLLSEYDALLARSLETTEVGL